MATAHLIHGYLAVGKTTFARALAEQVGGVLISLDDWYGDLLTDGRPVLRLNEDGMQRLIRALDKHWPQILRRDVDVVLDFGFWSRHSRDEARRLAGGAAADATLYNVTCRDDVALERCMRRNRDPNSVFMFDLNGFEKLRVKFEPLGPDERAIVIDTTASGHVPG